MDLLEQVQSKAAKVVWGMEQLSWEEKAKSLELFCLEKRRAQGDLVADFQYLQGAYNNREDFLQGHVGTGYGRIALN